MDNAYVYGLSFNDQLFYIGSSNLEIDKKLKSHVKDYKSWKNGNGDKLSWYDYFDEEDLNEIEISELEKYPCKSRAELRKREGQVQLQYKDEIVNKLVAGRTRREHREQNPELYRLRNKLYEEKNRESIKSRKADYYQKNKEYIATRQEKYRRDNLDRITEKIICDCGGKYLRQSKARHFKTDKHKRHVSSY